MAMTTDSGLDLIKEREGVRFKMYLDSAGLPTIGVGHLLTKDELSSGKLTALGGVRWTAGITPEQVDLLLRHDLEIAERAVAEAVKVPLSPSQFDTLVSFVFNVGVVAFRGQTTPVYRKPSTLLQLLNAGNYDAVPGQLRRWIHSAGRVDPILVKRREDEIVQWLSGW